MASTTTTTDFSITIWGIKSPQPLCPSDPLLSDTIGSIVIHIRLRYQLKLLAFEDTQIQVEDIATPELCYGFDFPPQVLACPSCRKAYVLSVLKSLSVDERLGPEIEAAAIEAYNRFDKEFIVKAEVFVDKIEIVGYEEAVAYVAS